MMSCALFLDPRFRIQIVRDEHKIQEAKTTLLNIWRWLITLDASKPAEVEIAANNTSTKSAASFEYDEQTELDKYLNGGVATESIDLNEPEREGGDEDIEHLLSRTDKV